MHSNCLSLWLFVNRLVYLLQVANESLLSPHCAAIHQCHTNYNTSAQILEGMPCAAEFLMVPTGMAHSTTRVALWKLLLVFTYWHLQGRQASCVSMCSEATLTSDFNVMGNVMALSLCSIVNSVTILRGIN